MQAAVLKSFDAPLMVETVPDPVRGTGEVIVDVVATSVVNYTNEVLSGARKYLLELPVIPGPGAIGRVRDVGPDATRLVPGDWVYCDPTVRSRDDVVTPDITLQGLSARGDGGLRLQRHFHDGSWAQQMRVPTENAVKIGTIAESDAPRWCTIGAFLVPYGGLLAANLKAGETILINGATGGFGSAGVAVALAMGAGCVVATGRNEASLGDLRQRYGERVRTVQFTGDEVNDRSRIMKTAQGPIDCVLDILPPEASPKWARAAIMAVRQNGRVALMGGIGMLGGGELDLPYAWIMRNCVSIHGQWMYPREAVTGMVGLIRAGLLNLQHYDVTTFRLDRIHEAVAHAAASAGPFSKTVIVP
jgi:alcohol dehydrogenase